MVEFDRHVEEAVDAIEPLAPLLAVPALVSLVNVGELQATLGHRGTHIGVSFVFPVPIGDLWTYVDTPAGQGGGVTTHVFGFTMTGIDLPLLFAGAVAYVIVHGVLAAGYVGSITQYRSEGSYEFLENIRRYGFDFIGVTMVIFGFILLMILLVLISPPLVVITFLSVLLAGYLLWGAWFLIPISNTGIGDSLIGSIRLALSERDYAVWSALHLLAGLIISFFATSIAANMGPVGIAVAIAGVVPAGFVLTAASVGVIHELHPTARPR